MEKKQIKQMVSKNVCKYKIIVMLIIIFSSYSCQWHYYLKTGGFCSVEHYDSFFTKSKGIEINKIEEAEFKKEINNSIIKTYIFKNPNIIFIDDTSCKTDNIIYIESKKVNLDSIWLNSEIGVVKPNSHTFWHISKVYKIETFKKKYLLLYLGNSWYTLQDFVLPLIIDFTDVFDVKYVALCGTYCFDTSPFGDFNLDSNLDYAQINDSLKRIEIFSFLDKSIIKNDSIYIELKNTDIPLQYFPFYKAKHIQNHTSWWYKKNYLFSVRPH